MKLPAFKLERFFAKYEFKAPYLLSSSDCEAMTIEELLSLEPNAAQEFHQTWLGYTETQGSPELRQEIAQTYQSIGIEDILVHAGAEEAIFIFMNIVLKPGARIVHFPCYQSHSSIAQSIGCEVDRFTLLFFQFMIFYIHVGQEKNIMSSTRTKILDVAEHLTQTRGFNGFSYLDLADAIGIKNSSIHYHFKAKADLALALVERIYEVHGAALKAFDKNLDTPQQRLQALVDFFQTYIQDEKFCMCGMMAAELQSVSPAVRSRLIVYFKDLQAWLTKQFVAMGETDAQNKALKFVSAMEGSLLLARLEGNPKIVGQALKSFIHD